MNPRAFWTTLALTLSLLLPASSRADTCGADGQRPCGVTERIPSCDLNLSEGGGRCFRAACGAEGQRPCGPTERFMFDFILQMPVPKVCDTDLLHDIGKGQCVHPPCGREGQRACTVVERVPSCDVNLFESNGRCLRPGNCGREGQPPCDLTVRGPIFRCDANLVPRNGKCMRPGTVDTQTAAASPATGATPPAPPPANAAPPPPPAPSKPVGGLMRPPPPSMPPAPAPAPTAAAGAIEPETDRIGADLIGFELAGSDPAQCLALCNSSGQCRAWSFVKPGVQGSTARCYLKSAAPAPTRNSCCASGVKSVSVNAPLR
jgi:hypothetical protein